MARSSLPPTALAAAIETAVRTSVEDGIPPREINDGGCADFADCVWNALGRPRVLEIVGDGDPEYLSGRRGYTHTWLRLHGRHYDAEAPCGVDDHRALPHFQRLTSEESR